MLYQGSERIYHLRKKYQKILLSLLIILALIIGGGLAFLKSQAYPANQESLQQITAAKQVQNQDQAFYFPANPDKKRLQTVVFYNGTLVDSQAYGQLALQLAQAGFDTYLLKTNLDLPILESQAAIKLIEDKHLSQVILAGHSLGGVMAAQNSLSLKKGTVAGLLLLAAYPSHKTNLAQAQFPVWSLVGDQDLIIKKDAYEDGKHRLPKNTSYIRIKGGNHAGFGNYGPQKGDGQATITPKVQQEQVVKILSQAFD